MPLTITPANVSIDSDKTVFKKVTVSEAVAQGQVAYNSGSNQHGLAINNDTDLRSVITGVFLLPAATGKQSQIVTKGPIIIGATVQVGKSYFLGSTAGIIFSEDELLTGQYVSFLGIAIAAGVIDVQPVSSRVVLA